MKIVLLQPILKIVEKMDLMMKFSTFFFSSKSGFFNFTKFNSFCGVNSVRSSLFSSLVFVAAICLSVPVMIQTQCHLNFKSSIFVFDPEGIFTWSSFVATPESNTRNNEIEKKNWNHNQLRTKGKTRSFKK